MWNHTIKIFRSDRDSVLISQAVETWTTNKRIGLQTSAGGAHQQVGLVERFHGWLRRWMETVYYDMDHLPQHLWFYVALAGVHTWNLGSHGNREQTAWELFHHTPFDPTEMPTIPIGTPVGYIPESGSPSEQRDGIALITDHRSRGTIIVWDPSTERTVGTREFTVLASIPPDWPRRRPPIITLDSARTEIQPNIQTDNRFNHTQIIDMTDSPDIIPSVNHDIEYHILDRPTTTISTIPQNPTPISIPEVIQPARIPQDILEEVPLQLEIDWDFNPQARARRALSKALRLNDSEQLIINSPKHRSIVNNSSNKPTDESEFSLSDIYEVNGNNTSSPGFIETPIDIQNSFEVLRNTSQNESRRVRFAQKEKQGVKTNDNENFDLSVCETSHQLEKDFIESPKSSPISNSRSDTVNPPPTPTTHLQSLPNRSNTRIPRLSTTPTVPTVQIPTANTIPTNRKLSQLV